MREYKLEDIIVTACSPVVKSRAEAVYALRTDGSVPSSNDTLVGALTIRPGGWEDDVSLKS